LCEYAGEVSRFKLAVLIIYQPLITVLDTDYLGIQLIDSFLGDRAYNRIDAGTISAAGQDPDPWTCIQFFWHVVSFLSYNE
jgi:hypothetical protein